MKHLVTIGVDQIEVELNGVGSEIDARIDGTPLHASITRDESTWTLTIDERPQQVRVAHAGDQLWVSVGSEIYRCTVSEEGESGRATASLRSPEVTAPMPGKVIEVAVEVGQRVAAGDTLVVLEAMKMETVLTAEAAAEVVGVQTSAGAMVEPGHTLVELAFD